MHAAVRRLHCHRFGLTICSLLLEESASSCANGNIPNHRRRAKTEQEERSIEFPFGASLMWRKLLTHPKKSHASPPTYNVKKGGYECLFTSRHFRLYLSDSSYVEVDAREDSPVSDAFLSTYQTQHYGQNGRFNTLLANQTDRPKLRSNYLGVSL